VAQSTPEPFRLESGDYSHMELRVTQVPLEVACQYKVLNGASTVHVELLTESEFRAFRLNRPHDAVALSPNSAAGGLRRVIEEPGKYEIVIANARQAAPVMVSLVVSTDLNPKSGVEARELPPRRRLQVILISFGLFFAIVAWSGLKLIHTFRRT
jgi:hypothetical protein